MIVGYSRASPAASYTGPGDLVSGAYAWWGLRAYNAAARGANAIRLIRASDSAQQDFVTLANGSLDVASIATFLASTTGKVVTIYDQSGSGLNLTQGTDANRPVFTLNGVGSLPCMTFTRSTPSYLTTSSASAKSQPFTVSTVSKRTGSFANGNDYFSSDGFNVQIGFADSASNATIYAGIDAMRAPAADNALHAIQAIANGVSSAMYVDGSATTNSVGTNATQADLTMGAGGAGAGNGLDGIIGELGLWPVGFDSTQRVAVDSNQRTYWGI